MLRPSLYVVIAVLLLILTFGKYLDSDILYRTIALDIGRNWRGNYGDVFNQTLGFEKIFVISLPERPDRRDAIHMQSSLSNLSVEIFDAVHSLDVSPKALPYTMEGTLTDRQVGRWRSHLNVMRHMVNNKISTALIMEDNADWDVAVRAQMLQAAKGARWLMNESAPHSPYGDHWDVLWLGHHGMKPHSTYNSIPRRWVVPRDPTVVPPRDRRTKQQPDMTFWEKGPEADFQTRTFFMSGKGIGSFAWAISLAGAERIIFDTSMGIYNDPVDTGMGKLCDSAESKLNCIAPYPSIFGVSSPPNGNEEGGRPWDRAYSDDLVFSTRLNMQRMLDEVDDYWSQYPGQTGEFALMEKIIDVKGHGWVRPSLLS